MYASGRMFILYVLHSYVLNLCGLCNTSASFFSVHRSMLCPFTFAYVLFGCRSNIFFISFRYFAQPGSLICILAITI